MKKDNVNQAPPDAGRRNFLARCCQSASAALLPTNRIGRGWLSSWGRGRDSTDPAACEFHLHPHYRIPRPLDALLLKAKADLDDFVTEKYADEIAAILTQWSVGLKRSPHDLSAIESALALDFLGASLQPSGSTIARRGPVIEARRNTFKTELSLPPETFLRDMKSSLDRLTQIVTADFQVTSVEANAIASGAQLRTRVRYELVAAGAAVHREQRVGYWDVTWERSRSGQLRVSRWSPLEETQSSSTAPCYADISAEALGGTESYSLQLAHGSDHWRTILDGACGIDIYGHNGVSVGDIDGDGYDDLYVCQSGGLPNRLYRNRGDGTFEDVTEVAGVGVLDNTACALFVDVDNDGRQDLIVVRASGPMLFLNQGNGRFRQKENAFRFTTPPQGTFTGAAAADYDRDGWLDIYFCLYVFYQGTGQYKYPSPYYDAENGPPNFLMRNQRDGTFLDVTAETGLNQNNTRYSFCCGWNDFNGDGWPDLYVVNDFGRKNLYRNNRDGTFSDIATLAGVGDVGAGMSVCWLDYDNDGAQDLYVADMWTAAGERVSTQADFKKGTPEQRRAAYRKHAMGNSLFRNSLRKNDPRATFEDATRATGVGIGRWAWASDAWDFDHDGYPDLYITNGMVSGPAREDLNSFFWRQVVANSPDEARPSQRYEEAWSAINELIRADGTWSGYERNIFYANNGDGTFCDISGVVGLDFVEDGRAFSLADFDHDGRQELFLKNRNGPQLRILKNVMPDLPPSISFRLRGAKSNPDAIGAVVTLQTEAGLQVRSLQAGSGFLSQHSKEMFFGLGSAKGPLSASIRWPSGLAQAFEDLPINRRVWIEEGSPQPLKTEPFETPASDRTGTRLAAKEPTQTEVVLPNRAETWLLAPIAAPEFSLLDLRGQTRTLSSLRGNPALLSFSAATREFCRQDWVTFNRHHADWAARGLQLVTVCLDDDATMASVQSVTQQQALSFPILLGTEDVGAIYNITFRSLFDRHRDLPLPTSFLIDSAGQIVKVYQGPVNLESIDRDFENIPKTGAQRIAAGLPLSGITDTLEFARNNLSIGSAFFQRGYAEQALASFELALRDDPSSAEALYGIGSVYLDLQRPAEARKSFEDALKLRAGFPDTMANSWNNLGLLSARAGNAKNAIPSFEQALKLSPDHSIALDNLGSAYRQEKRWDDARRTYERALRVNPGDAEAHYGLGMVFAQNGDTARAYDSLQAALRLRPIYPEALNNLGVLYLRTKRPDPAVASFEECIRVAPAFDQAYLNLARVYEIEGAADKARAALLALLRQHPNHALAEDMLKQLGQ